MHEIALMLSVSNGLNKCGGGPSLEMSIFLAVTRLISSRLISLSVCVCVHVHLHLLSVVNVIAEDTVCHPLFDLGMFSNFRNFSNVFSENPLGHGFNYLIVIATVLMMEFSIRIWLVPFRSTLSITVHLPIQSLRFTLSCLNLGISSILLFVSASVGYVLILVCVLKLRPRSVTAPVQLALPARHLHLSLSCGAACIF